VDISLYLDGRVHIRTEKWGDALRNKPGLYIIFEYGDALYPALALAVVFKLQSKCFS
jgi:hypothetical protein